MKIYWLLLMTALVLYFTGSIFQFDSQISQFTINILVMSFLGLSLIILIMIKYRKKKDSNIHLQIGLHLIATAVFVLFSLFWIEELVMDLFKVSLEVKPWILHLKDHCIDMHTRTDRGEDHFITLLDLMTLQFSLLDQIEHSGDSGHWTIA